MNVASNAPLQVTDQVSVSGGGSPTFGASDTATVNPTSAPPPVTTFTPGQGATGVATNASVTWGAVNGAAAYTVYFGTTNNPPLAMSGITGTSYTPPTMNPGTTYYWSVTAVNSVGSTPSVLWYFTTAAVTTTAIALCR